MRFWAKSLDTLLTELQRESCDKSHFYTSSPSGPSSANTPVRNHTHTHTHLLDTYTDKHTHVTQKKNLLRHHRHVYSKPRMCLDNYCCIPLNLTTKGSLTMCAYFSGQWRSLSNLRTVNIRPDSVSSPNQVWPRTGEEYVSNYMCAYPSISAIRA